MILTRIFKPEQFTIHQSLIKGGYLLDEPLSYYSPRYKKTKTVPAGRTSDGSTGGFDTVSRYWWIHDELCNDGTWDDGTPLTNWQCSQVLQDILDEERRLQRNPPTDGKITSKVSFWRAEFNAWFASKYRFWATFAIGGGKCRENGMLRLAAMLLVVSLLSINIPAFAHDCGCPKSKEEYKQELRQKLDFASKESAMLANMLAESPLDEWEHDILLRAYRYWSDRWEYYIIETNKAEREW